MEPLYYSSLDQEPGEVFSGGIRREMRTRAFVLGTFHVLVVAVSADLDT